MNCARKLASYRLLLRSLAVLLIGWGAVASTNAAGQSGDNAVYNSSGNCNAQSPCAASPAFIDAGVFGNATNNICTVLRGVLVSNSYPAYGAVTDARGLPATGTNMTCPSSQPSPWYGISSPPPSTILLPAGTIYIPNMWVLPGDTHLIGEGDGVPSGTSTTLNTTIQVSSTSYSDPSMIQFGSAAGSSGISVEKLILNGQGISVNGIVNSNAGDDSYVDHVSLYQIRGVGLLVENNATNSGPYTNILFDTSGTYAGTSATVCAQIPNVTGGTRGFTASLAIPTPMIPRRHSQIDPTSPLLSKF